MKNETEVIEKKVFLELKLYSEFTNDEKNDEAEKYFKQNVLSKLDEFGKDFTYTTVLVSEEEFYWSVPIYALREKIMMVVTEIVDVCDKIKNFDIEDIPTEKV